MTKKTWGAIALFFDLLATLVEVLVIVKVLPYNIICGGQIKSYEKVVTAAIFSIVIQLCLAFIIAIAVDFIKSTKLKKVAIWGIRIFTAYFCLNFCMNLMGQTWFEKIIGNILCVIQIVCYVSILRIERQQKLVRVDN